MPETITRIGSFAFGSCNLKNIKLPKQLTVIECYTFAYCKNLVNVGIPEGVEEIEQGAFDECSSLKSVVIPESVTKIGSGVFFMCSSLETITIPKSVEEIDCYTFRGCNQLHTVNYGGTKEQWKSVILYADIDAFASATIHCTDGDIVPTTENSITTGTASTSGSKFQAAFANAKAGKEYVVLVSRSGSDPLNADNLIYINQITADADGELAVPFITAADAAEMTYVVACAQDGAPVDPDQPGGDEPSSGDGGGAAIILIGGVAAVAAVAGVVLLMPVKVEGTVKLADQPVANATVQVLKGDTVKAETVTDANGHFTVKVKRGGYTLRVQWTDANGQPVMRTVDFKAPNANLNVAA